MNPTIRIARPVLTHPWYRKWECGELSVDSLRHYAKEYYWQVARFPRYLSALHSQLEELESRQVVLRNLQDEENDAEPHPKLWLEFAEALGVPGREIVSSKPGPAARRLIEEFEGLVSSGPAPALGALLAYESQVPEVARFKAEALEKHYLPEERRARGTRFFAVHREADVWHTQELDGLVQALPAEDRREAQLAADRAGAALWEFLDAMPN